mmetsp:Transcript_89814/g.290669  ORF Transcript_89814/g.290669 Transcript_89814/m.290669 type:complete len:553 (+) Transcript_89814:60-1718(+)
MESCYPPDAPVSLEALEQCVATLRKLRGEHGRGDSGFAFYDSASCRELRKAVAPFAARMHRGMFGGLTRSEYEETKALRREAEGRLAQRRALDRKHINGAAMRRSRLGRLAELQRQGEHLPLVPDGLGALQDGPVEGACASAGVAAAVELSAPRACYSCKRRFQALHHFYSDLCPGCAELNWQKRHQECDCRGRVALVTGGRVKIGFQVVLKLLRWGAHVIVTTRFPRDCVQRLASQAEQEGADWSGRLDVYGLDLRDLASIERFCAFCKKRYDRLDILINNACQTVRRPAGFYKHLLDVEESTQPLPGGEHRMLQGFREWSPSWQTAASPALAPGEAGSEAARGVVVAMPQSAAQSQLVLLEEDASAQFPAGVLDTNGQQLDLRPRNTWVMRMHEVEMAEVAEVFLINAMAPFVLNGRLQELMEKEAGRPEGAQGSRFIVNVSAMEGKFYRAKAPYHPHTNMAKAALNQLTRTVAGDLAERRIYVCAVDTGWVNDENPLEKARRYSECHNFQCPLDEVDAAARILDPVAVALSGGQPLFDVFLKDYRETEW